MKATKFVLSLPVSDLERSQQFYRQALNLDTEVPEDGMLVLELPGLSLFLIEEKEFGNYTGKVSASPLSDQSKIGCILTFGISSREELDEIMQRVTAAGGTTAGPVQESWGYNGYFRDPDGHLWELVWNGGTAAAAPKEAAAEEPEAKVEMLIRRPVEEVFAAFTDPEVMSKFWFTHSNGRIEEGKTLTWKWEQFGVEGQVQVKQVLENEFISFTWPTSANSPDSLVEISFEKTSTGTFLSISETGWDPADPDLMKIIAGQTHGWALVLSALKAYLEHQIVLTVVTDCRPVSTQPGTEANTTHT